MSTPPRPDPGTILPRRLLHWARVAPRATALRQKEYGIWRSHDWADYAAMARAFGQGLIAAGLRAGEHVAILSDSRREWVVAQLGINLAGGVAVGVYPTSPAPEVGLLLEAADVAMIVVEDQEQFDKVAEIRPRLPHLRVVVVIEPRGVPAAADEVHAYDSLLAEGARADTAAPALIDARLAALRPDDPALMVFTSGSTGRPKAAVLSYANISAAGDAVAAGFDIAHRDSVVSYLPLCHVAEQIFAVQLPMAVGYTVNFAESLRTVQSDVREIGPTLFLGVPRIWEKMHAAIQIKLMETWRLPRWLFRRTVARLAPLADRPRRDWPLAARAERVLYYWLILRPLLNFTGLRRTRVCFSGAAPIAPELLTFFRMLGVPLREVYGMTETCGIALAQTREASPVGSVGTPVAGLEVRLAEDGELLMRGPQIFSHYYRNDAATADAKRGGWLHSGDIAEAVGGEYRIVDRKKDLIITAGGKNIAPSEVENRLKCSPYIKEAVIIGEGRPYVSALVQIDMETTAKWAERSGLTFTTFRSLAEHDAVRRLIQAEIEAANATMPRVQHVRRFHLLSRELDHDDGEVTATMKIRRAAIARAFAAEIAALYPAEPQRVAS